jgi:transposase-like protein
LRYSLSYRDLEEMMRERGLSLDHTTIYRWVQVYAPELEKRIRPHLRPINDSYRVDETYVKVKGAWKYLYRALDSTGQTIDFMLSAKRDTKAAKRFFRKTLKAASHSSQRMINVDKNPAYPPAVEQLKEEGTLPNRTQLRQSKYLSIGWSPGQTFYVPTHFLQHNPISCQINDFWPDDCCSHNSCRIRQFICPATFI